MQSVNAYCTCFCQCARTPTNMRRCDRSYKTVFFYFLPRHFTRKKKGTGFTQRREAIAILCDVSHHCFIFFEFCFFVGQLFALPTQFVFLKAMHSTQLHSYYCKFLMWEVDMYHLYNSELTFILGVYTILIPSKKGWQTWAATAWIISLGLSPLPLTRCPSLCASVFVYVLVWLWDNNFFLPLQTRGGRLKRPHVHVQLESSILRACFYAQEQKFT